jgi:5'-3' exonuclease
MAKNDILYFHTGVRKDHKVVALLDGDIVAVKSAAVFDAHDGYEESYLHMLVRKTVNDWVKACGADDFVVCMSKGRSFRYDAYPKYKSNRTQPKPRGTDEAKQYLRDAYPTYEHDTLEADDVMGILGTEPQDKEIRVIVSTDKDMLQIPSWQFNPDRDRWPHKPDMDACHKFLAYQTTCGDPGDGYPGIPGFGIARFKKWWKNGETQVSLEVFLDNGLTLKDWTAQYDCAKMLLWNDRPEDFLKDTSKTPVTDDECPF